MASRRDRSVGSYNAPTLGIVGKVLGYRAHIVGFTPSCCVLPNYHRWLQPSWNENRGIGIQIRSLTGNIVDQNILVGSHDF